MFYKFWNLQQLCDISKVTSLSKWSYPPCNGWTITRTSFTSESARSPPYTYRYSQGNCSGESSSRYNAAYLQIWFALSPCPYKICKSTWKDAFCKNLPMLPQDAPTIPFSSHRGISGRNIADYKHCFRFD